MGERDSGFTLIELLVVILIVAILAAVAIPVFLRQRQKGYETQIRSALKNAAIAIESHNIEKKTYGDLNADPQLENKLKAQGFQVPEWAKRGNGYFRVKSDQTGYCVWARHDDLTAASDWRRSVYFSGANSGGHDSGTPLPQPDDCDDYP